MEFSLGNTPELLNEIIQYLQDDYGTLYSCILVNRLWCRLTIPLLWKDPFSMKRHKDNRYRYINVYLHYLDDYYKAYLSDYGINISVFEEITLFNYPSFIKCLKKEAVILSIKYWLCSKIEDDYLFLVRRIYVKLFEIFVENEANIHTYEFKGGDFYNIFIPRNIAQNPKFIYNVKNLLVGFHDSSQVKNFLKLLISSKSISKIHFRDECTDDDNDDKELIKEYSFQIINSQQNLKKFIFEKTEFS
jgi:hypothetical protein